MAEVSRARMDYPNYPVNIASSSFIRTDTAHAVLALAVDRNFGTVHIQHEMRRGESIASALATNA